MRAAVIGHSFTTNPTIEETGHRFSQGHHIDERAIEGALFVAALTAVLVARNVDQKLLACFAQPLMWCMKQACAALWKSGAIGDLRFGHKICR